MSGPAASEAAEGSRTEFSCRTGCGACCIAPSISSPIPGMPHGKPAGVPCVQLTADLRCALFGRPERPAVCASLRPHESMCGASREEAIAILAALEQATAPARPPSTPSAA
jgi:Fe-S-cluster containining protein